MLVCAQISAHVECRPARAHHPPLAEDTHKSSNERTGITLLQAASERVREQQGKARHVAKIFGVPSLLSPTLSLVQHSLPPPPCSRRKGEISP